MSEDRRVAELVAESAELRRELDQALARIDERAAEIAGPQIAALSDKLTAETARADQAAARVRDLEQRFAALVGPVGPKEAIVAVTMYRAEADNSTHADLRSARIADAAARWRQRGMRDPRDARIAAEAEIDRLYPY